RVFVAVAEAKSFAAAARKLALSPPFVTRAVAALETHVAAKLFHRTSRIVRLTEVGQRFLEDTKRILHDLESAERRAAGLHAEPRGRLTLTAPLMFGRLHVAPIALEFLRTHPQVTLRTLFTDQIIDILEEGAEVAIRIGRLEDSSLRAVQVGTLRRVVCASPQYLAARGTPRTPDELADHPVIAFIGVNVQRHWSFVRAGQPLRIEPKPRLIVNTADLAVAAACDGIGLTRVLSYQVDAELRAGTLARVLSEFEPPVVPVHVVHVAGGTPSASVRAFFDLAVRRLRASLRALTRE
ncbi:MAG TPA: LysR substrate-binding domain-containing protein, partial [Polyangiales bacterium]|nr:LysR substrate-binding domain-containing protein [Polyangiales bacterium]